MHALFAHPPSSTLYSASSDRHNLDPVSEKTQQNNHYWKQRKSSVKSSQALRPIGQRWSPFPKALSQTPVFTLQDHGYEASASRSVPVYISAFAGTHCTYPQRDGQAELTWVAGHIREWFTHLQMVTHSSTNQAWRWLTLLVWPMTLLTKPDHHL